MKRTLIAAAAVAALSSPTAWAQMGPGMMGGYGPGGGYAPGQGATRATEAQLARQLSKEPSNVG